MKRFAKKYQLSIINFQLLFVVLLLMGCKDSNSNAGTDPVNPTQSDVMTYITTADNTMHFDKVGKNFIEGMNMNPEITVTLDPATRYQEFDGFGAAITGASAYNLMRMPQDARAKLLKETFSVEEGMGYSYVRVPIGGSDFNAESNYDYTCCDMAGIENLHSRPMRWIISSLSSTRSLPSTPSSK